MQDFIDQLLDSIQDKNYKAYLRSHRSEFVDFMWDHENYPLYAFWQMGNVPDPKDEKTKKIVGLI